jgi:methionine-rich copper-binding protein CopC
MNKNFRFLSGRSSIASMALVMLLSFSGTNFAWARAKLVRSNPPDKAELKQPPAQVELWFNEQLEDGFNSVEVVPAAELSDKNHSDATRGLPKVDPADGTHLTTVLSTLKPGKYVVRYRVLSHDGHPAPGRITFQLLGAKP